MAVDLTPHLGKRDLHPPGRRRQRRLGPHQLRRLPALRRAARRAAPRPAGGRRRLHARGAVARGGREGDDGARRVQGHALRRRARRRPADRLRHRRPRPALGRRGVLLSRSASPSDKAQRPHPDLRGHGRRRPVRHAEGLRRQAEPGQRHRGRLRRRLGRRGARTSCSSPTRTATTSPTARRRSCSTAGATRTRTRRSTPSPGAPTAGSTAATASSPTRSVGKPGTPDKDRVPINAGIWRYHPTQHVFEVFAHGTSNPWGIDFDDHGQAFLTSCVIPHLYHVIQGGRYERQAGPHFNPYTYDDIKTIADHRHYLGANPHAGNGRSDAGRRRPRPRRGDDLPGRRLARGVPRLDLHEQHPRRPAQPRHPRAARARASSASTPPTSCWPTTRWSQIVSLKYGPDGQVYMIDWYDKNQCHHKSVDVHDRTNGRIFKVELRGPERRRRHRPARSCPTRALAGAMQLAAATSGTSATPGGSSRSAASDPRTQLAQSLDWLRRRRTRAIRLRGLWALHATGGLGRADRPSSALDDTDPYVRAWTIQLLCEEGASGEDLAGPVRRAGADRPVARRPALPRLGPPAAAARRPAADPRSPARARRGRDDQNLPLMFWYAAEPLADGRPRPRAGAGARTARIPLVLPFMARRIAAIGTPEAIGLLVDGLAATPRPGAAASDPGRAERGAQGRRQVAMPAAGPTVFAELSRSADAEVRSQATRAGVDLRRPGGPQRGTASPGRSPARAWPSGARPWPPC